MKVRTVKAHYDYNGKYRAYGSVYITDIVHADSLIRNGLCKMLPLPKREDKRHPKTIKGAIQKK